MIRSGVVDMGEMGGGSVFNCEQLFDELLQVLAKTGAPVPSRVL